LLLLAASVFSFVVTRYSTSTYALTAITMASLLALLAALPYLRRLYRVLRLTP
jgi:hypothetical protein